MPQSSPHTETVYKSLSSRWMDKEHVVHIYNGILLSPSLFLTEEGWDCTWCPLSHVAFKSYSIFLLSVVPLIRWRQTVIQRKEDLFPNRARTLLKKKKKKGMNLKTKLSWPSFKSLVENCWVADKTGSLVPRTLDFSIEKTWEVATWGCQVFRFLSTLTKILPLLKSFH